MIVLFEGLHYPTDRVRAVLADTYFHEISAGQCKVDYVGYVLQSPSDISPAYVPEPVLLLPKAFLNAQRRVFSRANFEGYDPLIFLDNIAANKALQTQLRTDGTAVFLFQFSVWLYQAIQRFAHRHPDSILTAQSDLLSVSTAGGQALSELEIVQSLLRFYQENQSLFTFIRRYNTSQQRRTDWGRTVSQQQPLIQDSKPVYISPIAKQKTAHYDEELLVLFMNTMQQLSQQYGFRLMINPLYSLLTESEFRRFQASATRRLKQIRSRYFSDKLVQLWQLLHLYYAHQEQMRSQRAFREVLLVRDFNIVFEDMIDALLSDPKPTLPAALKDQPDGKRVDHIYAYAGLLAPNGDEIYHIGDSKYYSAGNTIGPESVFKQFTYARNVIQLNIDLLNEGKLAPPLRYRDEVTEGYAPTPNFFISAFVNDLNFSTDDLKLRDDTDKLRANRHFSDRLFDRDTLLLQAYNINFLYVLATYVSPDAAQQNRFREATRHRFRTEMVRYLNKAYQFWKVTPYPGTFDGFVTKHFRYLIGRMYRPAAFEIASEQSLLIALSPQISKAAFLADLEKDAVINAFTLS